MRRPPPLADFPRYPVTGGTSLLAIGITVAAWSGTDISVLMEDIHIRQFQLWRVVTSALPHADILHLAFNLYWVWAFGTLIEETWGHLRTGLLFLLLAVLANGAEFAFLDGGEGLSGVGYGLFGLLWVLTRRGDRRFEDAVDRRTAQLFVGWFFFCVISTKLGLMPIANIAHGVGALAGGLLGWTLTTTPCKRWIGIGGMVVSVVAVLAGDTVGRPWINFSKDRGDGEFRLGYAAYDGGRYEEAADWYRQSLVAKPDDADAWHNLGLCWERLGKHTEAVAAYERAADIDPAGNPDGVFLKTRERLERLKRK